METTISGLGLREQAETTGFQSTVQACSDSRMEVVQLVPGCYSTYVYIEYMVMNRSHRGWSQYSGAWRWSVRKDFELVQGS